jgi:hypothetical protein
MVAYLLKETKFLADHGFCSMPCAFPYGTFKEVFLDQKSDTSAKTLLTFSYSEN